MPPFHANSLLESSVNQNTTTGVSDTALQVVCAWPVSGQYGPGSRVLYYVLVAACVFARKAEWLRNACLAAALLFPAVAALHGITLAVLHVDGAVDMDVYGAFQLCSLGILAAPVTAKLSRTYFYNPGRNIIFLWTALILAGLLSLTVEFFRSGTTDCTKDESGRPISPKVGAFPYGTTCGLVCSVDEGPFSPLRRGSANNIYVIPAPNKLTFNTATLFGAACSIPAILSLVSMWNKILEINWKSRFGSESERMEEPIEGTNGATVGSMKKVNNWIRSFLTAVEVPVFGAAVMAILVIGERNFFSTQVRYQTEPMASIGQWAPVVGTGLAILGSLYVTVAQMLDAAKKETESDASTHCSSGSMEQIERVHSGTSCHSVTSPGTIDPRVSLSTTRRTTSNELVPTTSRASTFDLGSRRKVAKALTKFAGHIGTAAQDQFDDSGFRRGKANSFPEVPGEKMRNSALPQIREQWDADRNPTPLPQSHSRAPSFVSGLNIEISSPTPAQSPPVSPLSPPSPVSPQTLFSPTPQRPRASVLLVEEPPGESQESSSHSSPSPERTRPRRDTLEVPQPVHFGPVTQSRPQF